MGYYSLHKYLSDNSPDVLSLDLCVNYVHTEKQFVRKLALYKADTSDVDLYRTVLSTKLNDVSLPFEALGCSENACCEHYDSIA